MRTCLFQARETSPSRLKPSFSNISKRSSTISGVALIVVLFAVALVSVVVLAYFNLAMLNRNISFSSAGQARANIVALSALDFIKSDFIAEIQAGSTQEKDPTGANVPIYLPSTNLTMVPFRMATNITPFDATIPYNLIKWSSGTYPLWPATTPYGSVAGPIRAFSGISSANGSVNGHSIGNSRWVKPAFSTSATFPTKVVPEWVYLTRQGPLATVPTPTISTLANSDPANASYVVGRYAYTVYDEGGLIDIAAAGYSPTIFSGDPTDVGRKGSQAFADLTQLGVTTTQSDQLVHWRNASTGTSSTTYTNYLATTNAPGSGFLKAAAGDQTFVGRQDFVQYWTNSTQLNASASMLPYLTTFSREKNAPSWGPEHNANDPASPTYWAGTNLTIDPVNNPLAATPSPLSYSYHDNEDQASITSPATQNIYNRFLPNVRVSKAFKRLSGDQATLGEPLVKNRFDLNKLGWISYNYNTTPTASAADILSYFGLISNSDGSWTYNHGDSTRILRLDEVAAAGREPDLFELLQAVILQGSLGLASGDPTHANDNSASGSGGEFYRLWEALSGTGLGLIFPYEAPLSRGDVSSSTTNLALYYAQEKYQIIQIGANMIDQADADNIPTDIILNQEHIYGVENLPYINGIAETVLRPAPGKIASPPDATFNDPAQQYVHQWATFSLWNPHQNAALAPLTGSGAPTKIRIAVTSGEEYPIIHNLASYPTAGSFTGRKFEPAGTTIVTNAGVNVDGPAWVGLVLSDYTTHFSEPTLISTSHSFTSDADNPASSNMNDKYGIITSSLGWQRAGIYLGWTKSPDNPYKVPLCATLPNYSNYALSHKNMSDILYDAAGLSMTLPFTIELQYQDTTTPGPLHWHTYQVFRGAVPASVSGAGDAYMEPNDPAWASWTATPPNNWNVTTNPTGYVNSTIPLSTVTQLIGANAGPLASDQEYAVSTFIDPRTGRFNMQNIHLPATAANRLAVNIGASSQVLPGADAGNPPYGHFPKAGLSKNSRDFPNTWINNLGTDPSYYLDRDFNRRVGDAAGWASASPLTTAAQAQRPFHLDRPFRSVAELGYVFRDDPWKTLNLISSNSGDSGLLDAFYVGSVSNAANDLPPPNIIGAKMNINSAALNSLSANSTVSLPLQALLSAGLRDYLLTDPTTISTSISSTQPALLATGIIASIKANGPLINIGDLPSLFPQDTTVTTQNPGLKTQREALVRALADSTDTRTWSLMIDVIAQAGKFSPTAANMNSFTVEGEKHYWLHVAVDRFTGEIVDQQLEPVWE
jgi:hypothetical protein